MDLNEQFSIFGEFLNQSYTVVENGQTGGFDADSYELILRYRDTFRPMADTDWVAGVGYGYVELEIFVNNQSIFNDNADAYTAYLGLRRTISQRLEGEIGVDFVRLTEGGSVEQSGEAALVYRVSPRLDIALGGVDLTDNNSYGIGLRYTWN